MGVADILFKKGKEQAEANLKEVLQFLEENKKNEGVVVLPSGLQYLVMKEGEGAAKPGAASKVTVHYEGKLLNCQVFDSSYQRGQTISFPLNAVIAGWTEGLQLMAKGSKYRLFIPPSLAYGDRQMGSSIPPCSTLIFDVELFSFE